MRALLVYNPNATTTRRAVIDLIAAALARDLKLDVQATKRRHHASYLAAGAVHEGYEVVFALGGDGTMNEVLQGLAGTPVRLGVIPGGSTNVWARTLGLPNDAIEATALLLRKLARGEQRTVDLGLANGRYFAFNAGYGFDAAAVRLVERRHRLKRTVRQATFLYCGGLAWLSAFDRRTAITLRVDGGVHPVPLRTVVCCKSNPYTYLGSRPAQLCPDAAPESGLDLVGLTGLSLVRLLRLTRAALLTDAAGQLSFTRLWHDRDRYELRADRPVPLQVDGDFVGETDQLVLERARAAATMIA